MEGFYEAMEGIFRTGSRVIDTCDVRKHASKKTQEGEEEEEEIYS
jgi:hypothetical protein